MVNIFLVCRSF